MGHPERLQRILSSGSDQQPPENVETDRTHDDHDAQQDSEDPQDTLDFESAELTSFPLSSIKETKFQITHLNIDYNKISSLPTGLYEQLPLLESFLANGNEVSAIPDDFGELSHLQELCVCENHLTSIPESLCKLTKLRILKVNANSLRKLHSEIGQNISLEILSADENHLKRFPATLGLLENLQVLEANNNKIEALPSTLNHLQKLQTLDLSNNRLTSIPESFGELRCLTHIDLSENRIGHLCERFESCETLERLYLDLNFFASAPDWFRDLEKISVISMKSNELSGAAFPEGFGIKSKYLKLLDLRGNFIQELPESFGQLASLDVLLLGTPVDYLERKPIFRNGNWLIHLPKSFANLTGLTKLHLEENQLKNLPDDIGKLIHLEDLYVGSNMFPELPASITKLKLLKRFQLSKNLLKKLPDDFGGLDSLTELYLDSNLLKVLPPSMKNLSQLEVLDLTDNKLKQVPNDIIHSLTRLRALNMFQNRFDVPHSDIPYIAKKVHYAEKNPVYKNNWRGKNNRPDVMRESVFTGPLDATYNRKDSKDCSASSDAGAAEADSSENEEDWDKEANQSITSSASTDRAFPVCNDEEEDWENEIQQPLLKSASGVEEGQFDLDDEPEKPDVFHLPTVQFDQCGNAYNVMAFDILSHCSTPFIFHAPKLSRSLYNPGILVPGQFDSDASDDGDDKGPDDNNEEGKQDNDVEAVVNEVIGHKSNTEQEGFCDVDVGRVCDVDYDGDENDSDDDGNDNNDSDNGSIDEGVDEFECSSGDKMIDCADVMDRKCNSDFNSETECKSGCMAPMENDCVQRFNKNDSNDKTAEKDDREGCTDDLLSCMSSINSKVIEVDERGDVGCTHVGSGMCAPHESVDVIEPS